MGAIQSSITSATNALAGGVAAVGHLAQMEKSNTMTAINKSEEMSTKLTGLAQEAVNRNTKAEEVNTNLSETLKKSEEAENALKKFDSEKVHRGEKGKFMSKADAEAKRTVLQNDVDKYKEALNNLGKESSAINLQRQSWRARLESFRKADKEMHSIRGYSSPDAQSLISPRNTQIMQQEEALAKITGGMNKDINKLRGK